MEKKLNIFVVHINFNFALNVMIIILSSTFLSTLCLASHLGQAKYVKFIFKFTHKLT